MSELSKAQRGAITRACNRIAKGGGFIHLTHASERQTKPTYALPDGGQICRKMIAQLEEVGRLAPNGDALFGEPQTWRLL